MNPTRRYIQVGALISACQQYRYRLWRRWNDGRPVLVFIMLNPSTADGEQDDPTIRKCVGFADRAGYGGIEILNLFAYRATKPADLKLAGWPVGPENDAHIHAVLDTYPSVICAWGANGITREGWNRAHQVMDIVTNHIAQPMALKLTANGVPWHPLMLGYDVEWVPYQLRRRT